MLLPLLAGCGYWVRAGDPYVNEQLIENNPPRSLAVMPTQNLTSKEGLDSRVRSALVAAVGQLPYRDVSIDQIDAAIAQRAEQLGQPPKTIPANALLFPELADSQLFSNVLRVRRLYLFVYSHTRTDLTLSMVDTRTREVIYRNHFRMYDRSGAPTITVLGLVERMIKSLWNLRRSELEESLLPMTFEVVEHLPAPAFEVTGDPGLQLTNLEVTVPRPTLGVGDRVVVRVEGTPELTASFSIGKLAPAVPLIEIAPGRYQGAWQVTPGMNAAYAVVTVHLESEDGRQIDQVANRQSFAVDTAAPPRAQVTEWWLRSRRTPGVNLQLAPTEGTSAADADKIARYIIYRRTSGQADFEQVGISTEARWFDESAERNRLYYYRVATQDQAGNISEPGPVRTVNLLKLE